MDGVLCLRNNSNDGAQPYKVYISADIQSTEQKLSTGTDAFKKPFAKPFQRDRKEFESVNAGKERGFKAPKKEKS